MPTGSTAVILPVPEAETLVGPWRQRFDKHAAAGVPAHITLLSPYLPPDAIRGAMPQLTRILGTTPPVFTLRSLSCWRRESPPGSGALPGLAVLEPDPDDWFHACASALCRATGLLPYGGRYGAAVRPHLTVAYGLADPAEEEARFAMLRSALAPGLPLRCVGREVWIVEKPHERWVVRDRLHFGTSSDQS